MPKHEQTKPKITLTVILKSHASLILPFDTRHDAQETVDSLWKDFAITTPEFRRLTDFLREPDEPAQP